MDAISIQKNASGRLWSEDPARWERLCSGEECAHCHGVPDDAWLLGETDACCAEARPEAVLPGYVCVFSKRHVVEPFELPPDEQSRFFLDCMLIAGGVAAATVPSKMNYEIHGNTVPHLHMHLFPRTAGDVYVGFPNHCRSHFVRSPADIDHLRTAVRAALGSRALT
jgi:diadenosine tetraphosphate (Ap4A) HIT family hydrolase